MPTDRVQPQSEGVTGPSDALSHRTRVSTEGKAKWEGGRKYEKEDRLIRVWIKV